MVFSIYPALLAQQVDDNTSSAKKENETSILCFVQQSRPLVAKPAYLKAKVASKVEDVEVVGGVEGQGVRVEHGHAGQPAEP